MAIIKPTLSLTANSNTVTTDPGPMSFALALSVTDNVTVDFVDQRLVTVTADVTANFPFTSQGQLLLDGKDVGGATKTPGTIGCYIYMKNTDTTAGNNIHVGILSGATLAAANSGTAAGTDAPLQPAASGTSALDATDNKTTRTFTLLPGEFAFFPFDYTGDIYVESAQNSPILEYWRYDR
jgi:hypothetical protein